MRKQPGEAGLPIVNFKLAFATTCRAIASGVLIPLSGVMAVPAQARVLRCSASLFCLLFFPQMKAGLFQGFDSLLDIPFPGFTNGNLHRLENFLVVPRLLALPVYRFLKVGIRMFFIVLY